MKIPKIKRIFSFLEKLPKASAEKAFLTFLVFLLISLLFGGFLFYRYSVLAKPAAGISSKEESLEFKEKVYQEILKIWQERDEEFGLTNSKKYPDPFNIKEKELPLTPEEF